MKVRFYTDPETGEPHIFRHGVTEDEALEVLEDPMEERRGERRSIVAIGRTAAGRYLRVVYSELAGEVFIITAYDLRGKPLKAFKRRMKP